MPQIYNGCGTWYYGKKNFQTYEGTCRACGRQSILTSYDTRLYVVIVMVPLIPLGKKRIIDQCAACKRHFAMPWDDYNRAESRLRETVEAYRRNPTDLDSAKEVLQACVSFRNLPAFIQVAPELEQGMADNAKGSAMLASVYNIFGRLPDVERLYRRAVEIEPGEDELRELLAQNLLRQGRPDEAEPYLRHVTENGVPDRVDLLYLLAQVYQAKGQHDKAITVFRQCEQVNPLITKDEGFNRLRDASVTRRGSQKPIALGEVTRKASAARKRRKFARVAVGVGILAIVAYIVLAGILGTRRSVYLVSGLDAPYTVTLDGKPYTLNPRLATKIMAGEGTHRIQITGPGGPLPAETVDIHSTFITRPFSKDVFVINPDAAAIIRHARVFYSSGGGRGPEQAYHGGKVLWHFDDVDHPFEKPPEKLSMDSSTREVSRVVLNVLGPETQMSGAMLLQALGDELGAPAVARMTQKHVQLEPDVSEYYGVLAITHKPAEIVSFLKPLLDQRPLRLQWHRTYQGSMSELGKDEQAEMEYAAMLAKEPQNKELMYLASRVMHDVDKSIELCRQAASGDSPSMYACFSLSGFYMETGEFREAANYGKRAISQSKGQFEMTVYYVRALAAAGDYQEALAVMRPEEERPWPNCVVAFGEEIGIACMMRDRPVATQIIDRMKTRLRKMDTATADRMVGEKEADVAYCFGDVGTFQRSMDAAASPGGRLRAGLSRWDLEASEKELAALEEKPPEGAELSDWHALAYLAAQAARNAAAAQLHLAAAADLLAKGDYEDRLYAEALRGKSTMPAGQFVKVRQRAERKVIYLAVLASSDPANRDTYAPLAAKLNYNPQFPHLLIEKALASAPNSR